MTIPHLAVMPTVQVVHIFAAQIADVEPSDDYAQERDTSFSESRNTGFHQAMSHGFPEGPYLGTARNSASQEHTFLLVR